MQRIYIFLIASLLYLPALAQKDTASIENMDDEALDLLFAELDGLFDSITKPRSYGTVSIMAANRLLNMQSQSGAVSARQSLMLSPSAGYFHKSGFGMAGTAALFFQNGQAQPAQYLATASYDFLRKKTFASGIAYTRFMNPEGAGYYTSPLKNEASAYFGYRKSWIKPSVAVSYGWGSHTEVEEQETFILKLRKRGVAGGVTRIETTETVSDWAVSVSARHDFYYFGVLTKGDNLRFTPQLSLSGGTQQWGFNQTSNAYFIKRSGAFTKPYASEQVALEEATRFQPLSLTAFLRTAYSKGKFFIQPQLVFDYYFPADTDQLTTTFMINTGLLF